MDISPVRHQSVFDPSKHREHIHIIGCGATGSRVFASLVELGLTNISCYDFDTVESHNLANQLFGAQQIGMPKVDALQKWYHDKTGMTPPSSMEFHNKPVDAKFPAQPLDGYVFLLTDSMKSRRQIYDIYLHAGASERIIRVIETRMAAIHGNVLHFDPNDATAAAAWEATLSDDEVTEVSACGTSISVGTTAALIANLAVQQYMWLCTNPAGANARTDIYLRPLMVITGDNL
jgi:molybdopterin/thiamine biosynthesis adenylyltransferase